MCPPSLQKVVHQQTQLLVRLYGNGMQAYIVHLRHSLSRLTKIYRTFTFGEHVSEIPRARVSRVTPGLRLVHSCTSGALNSQRYLS